MVAQQPAELVVVDYGCPDRVGDWVEADHPGVKVVRIDDDPGFCLSRARNMGAASTDTDWICFVDADICLAAGWIEWLRNELRPGAFFLSGDKEGRSVLEAVGTVCCSREAFDRVGGYDEVYRGYGGEDTDLYKRLEAAGYRRADYPSSYVEPILHDDSERVAFHNVKNRELQIRINRYYSRINRHIASLFSMSVPVQVRQSIMAQVQAQFLADKNKDKNYPVVEVSINKSDLVSGQATRKSICFTLVRKRRFLGLGRYKWYFTNTCQ